MTDTRFSDRLGQIGVGAIMLVGVGTVVLIAFGVVVLHGLVVLAARKSGTEIAAGSHVHLVRERAAAQD
jgi:cell division septation protein DedD